MLINLDVVFSCIHDVAEYLSSHKVSRCTRVSFTQRKVCCYDCNTHFVLDYAVYYNYLRCSVPIIIQKGKTVSYYKFGSKYHQNEGIFIKNELENKNYICVTVFFCFKKDTSFSKRKGVLYLIFISLYKCQYNTIYKRTIRQFVNVCLSYLSTKKFPKNFVRSKIQ